MAFFTCFHCFLFGFVCYSYVLTAVDCDCRLCHMCHMHLTPDSGLFSFELCIITKGDASLHLLRFILISLYVCSPCVWSDAKPTLMTVPTPNTKWEHSQMFTDKNAQCEETDSAIQFAWEFFCKCNCLSVPIWWPNFDERKINSSFRHFEANYYH